MGSVSRLLLAAAIALLALVPDAEAADFERLQQYGLGVSTGAAGGISAGSGVAVAPDGTVVSADISAMRLALFAQDGHFLRAFGKDVSAAPGDGAEVCASDCKLGTAGSGAGELSGPWGVVAASREIYVSELGNARVSVFNYRGQFLRAFGADVGGPGVPLCTSACAAGRSGSAAGEMAGPAGLALDRSGDLLVAELGSNRVDVFDPTDGRFLRAFGKDVGGPGSGSCGDVCLAGVADGSPGSVNASFGLAALPAGEVLVSERGASRVSSFSDDGRFLRAFGAPGSAAGQLLAPSGVASSAAGTAYVADTVNNRLVAFDPDGGFGWALGLDVVPGEPLVPETCVATCQAGASGLGIGELASPQAVAVDCRGAVYVATQGRIDKFGERGRGAPPCAQTVPERSPAERSAGSSPPPAAPPREFRFGRRRHDTRRGTLLVTVSVPAAGRLTARAGRRMRAKVLTPRPAAAGTVGIVVRAVETGARTLRRRQRLGGVVTATFTPVGGRPWRRSSRIQLARAMAPERRLKHPGRPGPHDGNSNHRVYPQRGKHGPRGS